MDVTTTRSVSIGSRVKSQRVEQKAGSRVPYRITQCMRFPAHGFPMLFPTNARAERQPATAGTLYSPSHP